MSNPSSPAASCSEPAEFLHARFFGEPVNSGSFGGSLVFSSEHSINPRVGGRRPLADHFGSQLLEAAFERCIFTSRSKTGSVGVGNPLEPLPSSVEPRWKRRQKLLAGIVCRTPRSSSPESISCGGITITAPMFPPWTIAKP